MIIWGSRTLTKKTAAGTFHCPQCAVKQYYTHDKMRRWFTLYFIPVVPLNDLGEHVTCTNCKKSWMMSVLANDPEKRQTELMDSIGRDWLNSMSTLAGIKGPPALPVAQTIVDDLAAAVGRQYKAGDALAIATAKREAPVNEAEIVAKLGNLPGNLSSNGKERFLVSALKVLRSFSNCGPAEIALVRALGGKLGISDSHVKGILLDAGFQ